MSILNVLCTFNFRSMSKGYVCLYQRPTAIPNERGEKFENILSKISTRLVANRVTFYCCILPDISYKSGQILNNDADNKLLCNIFALIQAILFKEATKSYITHNSCVVIVLFNTALCRSAFSTVSFRKLVFRLSVFSLNQDIKIGVIMLCNLGMQFCFHFI